LAENWTVPLRLGGGSSVSVASKAKGCIETVVPKALGGWVLGHQPLEDALLIHGGELAIGAPLQAGVVKAVSIHISSS
jgi:hypothetical protein